MYVKDEWMTATNSYTNKTKTSWTIQTLNQNPISQCAKQRQNGIKQTTAEQYIIQTWYSKSYCLVQRVQQIKPKE
jgi:hypothetical protein